MQPIVNGILGLLNSVSSIVREKTKDGNESQLNQKEKVRNGVVISSKRVLNLVGAGSLLTYGISYLSKATNAQETKIGLVIIGVGAAYSVSMSFITAWQGKNK